MPNFLSMNARRSLNRATPYQRRWGISDPRASIGFEREITVRVEANRLIVGNAFQVSFTAKSTQNELAAGMLEALELTVRKWGRPPMSFYWVPTVRFEVGAAELGVYQLLDQTAKAWGLETSAEAIEN